MVNVRMYAVFQNYEDLSAVTDCNEIFIFLVSRFNVCFFLPNTLLRVGYFKARMIEVRNVTPFFMFRKKSRATK